MLRLTFGGWVTYLRKPAVIWESTSCGDIFFFLSLIVLLVMAKQCHHHIISTLRNRIWYCLSVETWITGNCINGKHGRPPTTRSCHITFYIDRASLAAAKTIHGMDVNWDAIKQPHTHPARCPHSPASAVITPTTTKSTVTKSYQLTSNVGKQALRMLPVFVALNHFPSFQSAAKFVLIVWRSLKSDAFGAYSHLLAVNQLINVYY